MREVKQVSRHLYTECGTLEEEEGEAIPPLLVGRSEPSDRLGRQVKDITVLGKSMYGCLWRIGINGGIPYEG